MRKLIAAVSALCIVGGAIPTVLPHTKSNIITANAEEENAYEDVKEGSLTYRIYPSDPENEIEAYAEVVKCDETFSGDLAIPEEIKGVPVVKIKGTAFYGCYYIDELFIPASVEEIEVCYLHFEAGPIDPIRFKSVTVDENNPNYSSQDGVLFNKDKTILIRAYNFYSDKEEFKDKLIYTVPDTVTEIASCAFYYTDFEKVTLPDSVKSIGYCAFERSSIKEITIPDSVIKIDDEAFKRCTSLKSVSIPDSIEVIGGSAFASCSSLTEVKLPKYITEIPNSMFEDCEDLKEVKIPGYVGKIGTAAFAGTGIEHITLPGEVKQLGGMNGSSVFDGCKNLKSVTVINPDCQISDKDISNVYDREYSYNGVIFGRPDSATQKSAEEAGFTFIPMDLDYGEVRITLIDYDTGELIPDSYVKEHNYSIGTDIGVKKDDVPGGWLLTGPVFNAESNPTVIKDELAELYEKADKFSFTNSDDVFANLYTNETFDYDYTNSMDIVARVKTAAGSYLKPGQVEVKLLDYDTGKPLELTDKFDYRLPFEIRTVDPETGEYGDYVDLAGPQVTSNNFICDEELNIKSGWALTSVNIKNDALPTGYKCPTNAGEIVKNANGSYTVTVKLTATLPVLKGDANLDHQVNIADAVLVMQVATNPDKYGPDSKDEKAISSKGFINADVDGKKGLTNADALLIQQFKLGIIDKL